MRRSRHLGDGDQQQAAAAGGSGGVVVIKLVGWRSISLIAVLLLFFFHGSTSFRNSVITNHAVDAPAPSHLLNVIGGRRSRMFLKSLITSENMGQLASYRAAAQPQTSPPQLGPHPVHRLLQGMCPLSAYPSTCLLELSPLAAAHPTADPSPSAIASLSLQAATSRAQEALQLATTCSSSSRLSLLESQCADDCMHLLGRTKDLLETVVSTLSQLQIESELPARAQISSLRDVMVLLSSAMSYQAACADGFDDLMGEQYLEHARPYPLAVQQLLKNQDHLSQVIGNVLSLVHLLAHDNIAIAPPHHPERSDEHPQPTMPPTAAEATVAAHRLLSPANLVRGDDDDLDDQSDYGQRSQMVKALHYHEDDITLDGFPEWVSPTDRRLLLEAAAPAPAISPDDNIIVPPPPPHHSILANVVVAQDGSGNFFNITSALNSIPHDFPGRFVVYIKAGEYSEMFNVTQDQKNITFVGDGIGLTVITGNRNVASGLFNTFRTSTVGISGDGFFARDITFRNTAGPSGHQAVALRAGADKVIFYRCSFEGFQDTLYALSGLQFYRECQISGTLDFIFGNAIAVFQNCRLLARLPMEGQTNTYTAQGRKQATDVSGFTFHNCTIAGDADLLNATFPVSTYLGRPWKAFSRVVFMQSQMEALVAPQGWMPWNQSNPFTTTLFYGEFQNRGPGSSIEHRITWPGVHANLTFDQANAFTVQNFLHGTTWLPSVLAPLDFVPTLFNQSLVLVHEGPIDSPSSPSTESPIDSPSSPSTVSLGGVHAHKNVWMVGWAVCVCVLVLW